MNGMSWVRFVLGDKNAYNVWNMPTGKFIVLYGPNNIGKSTQVRLLARSLEEKGKKVVVIKYPVYDLEPTGPFINEVLRRGKQVSHLELQQAFAQNRRDYEPQLRKLLSEGFWVISEDYRGTGIAWGVVSGVPLEILEDINDDLMNEDFIVMMDGERFIQAIETTHINEKDDARWQKGREVHLMLANRYGWPIVSANQTVENVRTDIFKLILARFESELL